jgi:hypothetical protein
LCAVCVAWGEREKKEFYGFLHHENWRGPFSPGVLLSRFSLALCSMNPCFYIIHQFISGLTVTVTLLGTCFISATFLLTVQGLAVFMDRHTNLFFSDVDVARFTKGRTLFPGEPHSDVGDRFQAAARILPTAEHHQSIREEEERRELHKFRTEGEYFVSVGSLPYVHGESSEGIEQQRRKQGDPNNLHVSGNIGGSCAVGHGGIVRSDGAAGGKSGEEIISDEFNEKRNAAADISARNRRVYSYQCQDGGGDSSEEKSSDGSMTSPNEVSDLGTDRNAGNNAGAIPTIGSEAIGGPGKAMVDSSVWHSRRSESEVVLSRIKRKEQRSLSKRQRCRSIPAAATANAADDETVQRRRTTLRFAAAPVAANKRKKQKTLKDMFIL